MEVCKKTICSELLRVIVIIIDHITSSQRNTNHFIINDIVWSWCHICYKLSLSFDIDAHRTHRVNITQQHNQTVIIKLVRSGIRQI